MNVGSMHSSCTALFSKCIVQCSRALLGCTPTSTDCIPNFFLAFHKALQLVLGGNIHSNILLPESNGCFTAQLLASPFDSFALEAYDSFSYPTGCDNLTNI